MRSSVLLRSANWKYVVGELLLIVVGVTLALMASSWYENRGERQDESQSLQQISLALEADLAFFAGAIRDAHSKRAGPSCST